MGRVPFCFIRNISRTEIPENKTRQIMSGPGSTGSPLSSSIALYSVLWFYARASYVSAARQHLA